MNPHLIHRDDDSGGGDNDNNNKDNRANKELVGGTRTAVQ
jgi:hypothetical protein